MRSTIEYAELEEKINRLTSELVLVSSKLEAICEVLRGEEVSDFMLSFPEVRQVSDMVGYGGIKRVVPESEY